VSTKRNLENGKISHRDETFLDGIFQIQQILQKVSFVNLFDFEGVNFKKCKFEFAEIQMG